MSAALPDRAPTLRREAAARAQVPSRPRFDSEVRAPDGPARSSTAPPVPVPRRRPRGRRGSSCRCGAASPTSASCPSPPSRARTAGRCGRGGAALGYGDPRGHPRLRAALAAMLSATRGVAASPTSPRHARGQMAFDLLARALVAPGDVVAVEAFGYRPAWRVLTLAGAKLVTVPVDERGASVDAIRRVRSAAGARRLPHAAPPVPDDGGARPGPAPGPARAGAREAHRRHRGRLRPRVPLRRPPRAPAGERRPRGVVVYIGTLSKILAPGLRIGYVVAPRPLVDALTALRGYVDRQGDHAVEHAVAELMEDGEVQRHARRARAAYAERRDVLADALERTLGDTVSFARPPGGTAPGRRSTPRRRRAVGRARARSRRRLPDGAPSPSTAAHAVRAVRLRLPRARRAPPRGDPAAGGPIPLIFVLAGCFAGHTRGVPHVTYSGVAPPGWSRCTDGSSSAGSFELAWASRACARCATAGRFHGWRAAEFAGVFAALLHRHSQQGHDPGRRVPGLATPALAGG